MTRFRLIILGLAAAALCAAGLGLAPAAPAALAARAQGAGPQITCASGYFYWRDSGGYTIQTNGSGNDVTAVSGDASCFEAVHPYTDPYGTTGHQYQDESGNCLYVPGGQAYAKIVNGNCNGTSQSEQFFGISEDNGYYSMFNQYNQSGMLSPVAGCGYDGSDVTISGQTGCAEWDFPS